MKKTYNILITVAAFLAFASVVSAQTDYSINGTIRDPNHPERTLVFPKDNGLNIDTEKKVAYSKNISSPFSDGTYWIKLETFATGSASFVQVDAPADIVLVLDLSSSMVNNYVSYKYETEYTPNHSPYQYWQYGDCGNNTQYYYPFDEGEVDEDGDPIYSYWRVQQDRVDHGRNANPRYHYYMYFDKDGTRYYLVKDQLQVGGNPPENVSSNATRDYPNNVIWTGPLRQREGFETRLDALKRATCDFIDEIEKNDKYEDDEGTIERKDENNQPKRLGNRISIVTFNSSASVVTSLAEGELRDASSGGKSTADALKDEVNAFGNGSGTRQDLGLEQANAQLALIDSDRLKEASRTVVLFTDGEPYRNGTTTETLYNNAIQEALKTKTADNPETTTVEGYGATVFTVGLFTETPLENDDLWNFMNYMSSNAPNASNITTSGANFNKDGGFYKDASGENADLSAVFTEIAKQSAGTSTTLSAATSTVDVVSNSFILPDGADAEHIKEYVKVYTAKLNRIENGNYVFDTEIMVDHNEYEYDEVGPDGLPTGVMKDVDDDIDIELIGTNGIKVVGFDYSSNWCGPVYKEDNVTLDYYNGHKIIIMIPIQMNPDAVGGPNVETNGDGSGIYANADDEDAFIPFKSPDVSLPVNIYISKTGLHRGESAKFKIERAIIPDKEDWADEEGWTIDDIDDDAWSYVTSVFVTQPMDGTDEAAVLVKVRGLPANTMVGTASKGYVYRITEEEWSWSYLRDTTPQYTVTSKVDNPFYFDNDQKDDIDMKLHHAESKANNIFKANGATIIYTDSKNNTGTGRY